MKKKVAILALALVLVLALTGCACKHEWVEADCVTPKTCSKCQETEGEALGHTWVDADCVTPKTCSVCAATEGEALGHTWVDADCVTPKTCSVCAATEGEALGHTFVDADCVTPKTCSVCAFAEGEALGHTWVDATCDAPKTCSVCALTEGEALGHTFGEAELVDAEMVKVCSVCAAEEKSDIILSAGLKLVPYTMDDGFTVLIPADWTLTEDTGSEQVEVLLLDEATGYFITISRLPMDNVTDNALAAERLSATPDQYVNVELTTNLKGVEIINNENAGQTLSSVITLKDGIMYVVLVSKTEGADTTTDALLTPLRNDIASYLYFK